MIGLWKKDSLRALKTS